MCKQLLVLLIALAPFSGASAFSLVYTIDNNPLADCKDCPVALPLSRFPECPVEQRARLAVFLGGEEISSQLDDLNADGIPDEIAFLMDIRKGVPAEIELRTVSQRAVFPKEVHAQMFIKGPVGGDFRPIYAEGKHYGIKPVTEQSFLPADKSFNLMHHHGVAFESSLMAYRIYFDKRQTVDVYAKKTPRLELAESLWYPNDDQLAAGFGDDVLRVGNSIGVGSVRAYDGERLVKMDRFRKRTQRILAQGNIRTVCEVELSGWQLSGDTVDIRVRYTLYARHRDVLCEVFLSHAVPNLVTGVMKISDGDVFTDGTLLGSWGTDWPVNDTVKYPKETIGIAVYVPELYAASYVSDSDNHLICLAPSDYLRFYLTAVSQKENNPPAVTMSSFWTYISDWRRRLHSMGY